AQGSCRRKGRFVGSRGAALVSLWGPGTLGSAVSRPEGARGRESLGRAVMDQPAEQAADRTEAIVIGSGFGGAVAACRLAQAGFAVLILERGRRFEKDDFPALPTAPALLPDLRRWVWQTDQGLWDLQDLEEIPSVQAAGYGGGSLIYANVHLRPPAAIFERGWPKIYRDPATLAPFFDLAGYMLDV